MTVFRGIELSPGGPYLCNHFPENTPRLNAERRCVATSKEESFGPSIIAVDVEDGIPSIYGRLVIDVSVETYVPRITEILE